jgi:mycofactocin system glycosyltransferase
VTTPLPEGFGLVLDPDTRVHGGGLVLAGGHPGRVLRLRPAGRAALDRLLGSGGDAGGAERALARRLVDAGLAHPRPPATTATPGVTVVVPVRDRTAELDRCLAAVGTAIPVVVVDDGSAGRAAVAAVCARYGARLLTRPSCGGPAAARATALGTIATELVAFLDSDCEPPAGWLPALAAHFADPLVGAVAPRVRPAHHAAPGPGALRCYSAARSPLDMGPREAAVGPGRPVPYVPTAALLVRRAALGAGFDQALRYGEDVDLVWRLLDGGWRVRYDPAVTVAHAEPDRWAGLLARRFRYGTSAAPLARRHPGRLAPAILRPWPTAAAFALLAGRPGPAVAVAGVAGAVLAGRLHRAGVPPVRAVGAVAGAVTATGLGLGRAATQLAAPALLAMAARPGRSRRAAAALLLGPPLAAWWRQRPPVDPLRWAAASIADDAAYGAGVWWGCVTGRTAGPLRPSIRPLR